jgi:hypothetical protein
MAVFFGKNLAVSNTATTTRKEKVSADLQGGQARYYEENIDLSLITVTTADTIVVADVPAGLKFVTGWLNSSGNLGGTATVAIGITGAAGKYRAAAVVAAGITQFGVLATIQGAVNASPERIFITVAAANLPTTGTLSVQLLFSKF